jgi:hypothetical protein
MRIKMISSLNIMTDKFKDVTYKELCKEVYSITHVIHTDGRVNKNARGYSPDWYLQPKLDRRIQVICDAKDKKQDYTVYDKPVKLSGRVWCHTT